MSRVGNPKGGSRFKVQGSRFKVQGSMFDVRCSSLCRFLQVLAGFCRFLQTPTPLTTLTPSSRRYFENFREFSTFFDPPPPTLSNYQPISRPPWRSCRRTPTAATYPPLGRCTEAYGSLRKATEG